MDEMTKFRIYADGTVVHEYHFVEYDSSQPYYDDYGVYEIPTTLVDFMMEG